MAEGAPREKCGVAGVYHFEPTNPVAYDLFKILLSQFTRGHEGAGIAVHDSLYNLTRVHKGLGKVRDVFSGFNFGSFTGNAGIGHNRYGTVDIRDRDVPLSHIVQPITTESQLFHLSHNGTLPPASLASLRSYSRNFSSDTEALAIALEKEFNRTNNYVEAMKKLEWDVLDGSYTCTLLTNDGKLIAFREPKGFKPLSIGETERGFVIASETSPLEFQQHAKNIRPVEPGEMIIIENGDYKNERFCESCEHAHCAFEWVYFQKFNSIYEGVASGSVRKKLGAILAKKYAVEADSVGPVPDSGRSAAIGYHQESGLPLEEYIMTNRELGRLFIIPNEEERRAGRELKYEVDVEAVRGKSIVLIDDSIVRSGTIGFLVKLLRKYGAKEIHVGITFPPIKSPCIHGGIAFTTKEELAFNRYGQDVEEIRKTIGADSLSYTTPEDLREAIGLNDICRACVTGEYPLKDLDFNDSMMSAYVRG